jgi:hypothetical protein
MKENQKKSTNPDSINVPPPKGTACHTDVSGSIEQNFSHVLINQTANTLWPHKAPEERDKQYSSVLAAMYGIRPKDEVEGMLAGQMIGLHNAAMECMRRAMISEQTFEGRRESLNQASKLTRSYATLVEALNRYRGKGVSEQKVTVEHVHVHAGGQAIVGNVTREGGGDITKTQEQPYAKHITHQETETLPCQNTQRNAVPVPVNAEW